MSPATSFSLFGISGSIKQHLMSFGSIKTIVQIWLAQRERKRDSRRTAAGLPRNHHNVYHFLLITASKIEGEMEGMEREVWRKKEGEGRTNRTRNWRERWRRKENHEREKESEKESLVAIVTLTLTLPHPTPSSPGAESLHSSSSCQHY